MIAPASIRSRTRSASSSLARDCSIARSAAAHMLAVALSEEAAQAAIEPHNRVEACGDQQPA